MDQAADIAPLFEAVRQLIEPSLPADRRKIASTSVKPPRCTG
jgi:hypothetical protein